MDLGCAIFGFRRFLGLSFAFGSLLGFMSAGVISLLVGFCGLLAVVGFRFGFTLFEFGCRRAVLFALAWGFICFRFGWFCVLFAFRC